MSINSQIIGAVSDIAPCYPWEAYEGSGDTKLARYFVFNYNTLPVVFGDDEPPYERYIVQLHYYCPLTDDTVALRKKVKRALYDAGFTFPTEYNASDNDGQHYTFEFEALDSTEVDDG